MHAEVTALPDVVVIALAFVAVAPTQPPPPALASPQPVLASLAAIRKPLSFAGDCIERQPKLRLAAEYERIDDGFISAAEEAEGTWPEIERGKIYLAASNGSQLTSACSRKSVSAALQQADAALNAHSRLFQQMTAGMTASGLWIAYLQFCRSNVLSSEMVVDALNGKPALSVRLAPAIRGAWSMVLEQAAGRPLSIRVAGRTIGNQTFHERPDKANFHITGFDRAALSKMTAALKSDC